MALSQQALEALQKYSVNRFVNSEMGATAIPVNANQGTYVNPYTAKASDLKRFQSMSGFSGGKSNSSEAEQRYEQLKKDFYKNNVQSAAQAQFNPIKEVSGLVSKDVMSYINDLQSQSRELMKSPDNNTRVQGLKLKEQIKSIEEGKDAFIADYLGQGGGKDSRKLGVLKASGGAEALKGLLDRRIQEIEADPNSYFSSLSAQDEAGRVQNIIGKGYKQELDWLTKEQQKGALNPFQRIDLQQAQLYQQVDKLFQEGKTDEAVNLFKGGFVSEMNRNKQANIETGYGRAVRNAMSAQKSNDPDKIRAANARVQGLSQSQLQSGIQQSRNLYSTSSRQAGKLASFNQFSGGLEQGIFGRPNQFITAGGLNKKFNPGNLTRTPEQSAFISSFKSSIGQAFNAPVSSTSYGAGTTTASYINNAVNNVTTQVQSGTIPTKNNSIVRNRAARNYMGTDNLFKIY